MDELKIYMITWSTHNTRISERMIKFWVQLWVPVILNESMEIEISGYILQIINEFKLEYKDIFSPQILAYNICKDHVHMILKCYEWYRDNMVRKFKWKSTQLYKNNHGITEQLHLWGQKYNRREIIDEKYLYNAINYVENNREKHGLPISNGLLPVVHAILG